MQPPSEADTAAEIRDLLRCQKLDLESQIKAMNEIGGCFRGWLTRMGPEHGCRKPLYDLAEAVTKFTKEYCDKRSKWIQATESFIAYDDTALAAYRSGNVPPTPHKENGMQPPSEADIVAATQSLEVRRDLKRAQMETLHNVQDCLGRYHLPGSSGSLEDEVSVYLGLCVTEHRLDVEVLEAQIAYNNRVLAAYRSSIVLPTYGSGPRKPSN